MNIISLLQPRPQDLIYREFRPDQSKLAYIVLQGSADVFRKRICTLQLKQKWNWKDFKRFRRFQTYLKVNTLPDKPNSNTNVDDVDFHRIHDTRVKLSFNLYHLVIFLRKGDILKCLLTENQKIGKTTFLYVYSSIFYKEFVCYKEIDYFEFSL